MPGRTKNEQKNRSAQACDDDDGPDFGKIAGRLEQTAGLHDEQGG